MAELPTTTTPASVLAVEPPETASAVSEKALEKSEVTEAPLLTTVGSVAEVAWSSLMAARLTGDDVRVGASFSGVTVRLTVSVAEENAVVPP